LRWINMFGNPIPWRPQRTPALTLASFLNVLKYPPSLDFLLMTLGPALVALAVVERARGRVVEWLSVYGRVPLFFYVTHIFVAHAVAILLAFWQSGEVLGLGPGRRAALLSMLADWTHEERERGMVARYV
jgi:uncharacterized membrane protein